MPAASTHQIRTIIVSGLSGSGKTTAIHALEDIGFFCIDNLPVILLEQVLSLCERGSITDVAVGMDVREREFLADYEHMLKRLKESGYSIETLYLTCDDEMLIRRFKETRRRHPLQGDGSIGDGIEAEREALHMIWATANHLEDTSSTNVHELRRRVQEAFRTTEAGPLLVRIVSFGFKHGILKEADYVFDVRFLPNPYFVEGLRELSGCDPGVIEYLEKQPDVGELLDHLVTLLEFVLPRAVQEGKPRVVVGVGCTGGQHRSVAVARWLRDRLKNDAYRLIVEHRNMKVE